MKIYIQRVLKTIAIIGIVSLLVIQHVKISNAHEQIRLHNEKNNITFLYLLHSSNAVTDLAETLTLISSVLFKDIVKELNQVEETLEVLRSYERYTSDIMRLDRVDPIKDLYLTYMTQHFENIEELTSDF